MVQFTARDRIWIVALSNLLGQGEPVTPAHLSEKADCSERTARDVLKTMSENGLVQEDRIPDGRVRYVPDGILERKTPT